MSWSMGKPFRCPTCRAPCDDPVLFRRAMPVKPISELTDVWGPGPLLLASWLRMAADTDAKAGLPTNLVVVMATGVEAHLIIPFLARCSWRRATRVCMWKDVVDVWAMLDGHIVSSEPGEGQDLVIATAAPAGLDADAGDAYRRFLVPGTCTDVDTSVPALFLVGSHVLPSVSLPGATSVLLYGFGMKERSKVQSTAWRRILRVGRPAGWRLPSFGAIMP